MGFHNAFTEVPPLQDNIGNGLSARRDASAPLISPGPMCFRLVLGLVLLRAFLISLSVSNDTCSRKRECLGWLPLQDPEVGVPSKGMCIDGDTGPKAGPQARCHALL